MCHWNYTTIEVIILLHRVSPYIIHWFPLNRQPVSSLEILRIRDKQSRCTWLTHPVRPKVHPLIETFCNIDKHFKLHSREQTLLMAKYTLGSNTKMRRSASLWTILGPLLASLGVVPTREIRERTVSRRGAEKSHGAPQRHYYFCIVLIRFVPQVHNMEGTKSAPMGWWSRPIHARPRHIHDYKITEIYNKYISQNEISRSQSAEDGASWARNLYLLCRKAT